MRDADVAAVGVQCVPAEKQLLRTWPLNPSLLVQSGFFQCHGWQVIQRCMETHRQFGKSRLTVTQVLPLRELDEGQRCFLLVQVVALGLS